LLLPCLQQQPLSNSKAIADRPCLQQQPPSNSKAIADRQFFSDDKGKPTNLSTYLFRAISIGLASRMVSPNSADKSQEWSTRHFFEPTFEKPSHRLTPHVLASL
jgi:hypothetical protein